MSNKKIIFYLLFFIISTRKLDAANNIDLTSSLALLENSLKDVQNKIQTTTRQIQIRVGLAAVIPIISGIDSMQALLKKRSSEITEKEYVIVGKALNQKLLDID